MDANLAMSSTALVVSSFALLRSLRMSNAELHEHRFYLDSYSTKIGRPITWRQRLAAWNAAKGGRAPTWHWIPPVVSPFNSMN